MSYRLARLLGYVTGIALGGFLLGAWVHYAALPAWIPLAAIGGLLIATLPMVVASSLLARPDTMRVAGAPGDSRMSLFVGSVVLGVASAFGVLWSSVAARTGARDAAAFALLGIVVALLTSAALRRWALRLDDTDAGRMARAFVLTELVVQWSAIGLALALLTVVTALRGPSRVAIAASLLLVVAPAVAIVTMRISRAAPHATAHESSGPAHVISRWRWGGFCVSSLAAIAMHWKGLAALAGSQMQDGWGSIAGGFAAAMVAIGCLLGAAHLAGGSANE